MPPPGDLREGSTRRDPSWLLLVAAALLIARVIAGFYEKQEPGPSPFQFQGQIRTSRQSALPPATLERPDLVAWRSIEAGPAEAAGTGRPILYDFTAAWCGPCRLLNREVFSDAASAAFINQHFVPVRVLDRSREDGRNPADIDALQSRFRITGFPTLVVLPPGGRAPIVMDGYRGKEGTMAALQAAAERAN